MMKPQSVEEFIFTNCSSFRVGEPFIVRSSCIDDGAAIPEWHVYMKAKNLNLPVLLAKFRYQKGATIFSDILRTASVAAKEEMLNGVNTDIL